MTTHDAYLSGFCAGSNAAAGQGPRDEPMRGKTKKGQAYHDGWHAGFEEVSRLLEAEKRAQRMTLNSWAS